MTYKENILQYSDYCALRESIGWRIYPKEQTIHALEHTLYNVVAVDDEKTIGMCRLVGDGLYYTIVDVVVNPSYQGKGIGKGLIERTLQYIDQHTPTGGYASIQLISVAGKEAFYEKFGFKKIPHADCGSGMQIILRK